MGAESEMTWTLVACGLVAHADGVLDVGEWDCVVQLLQEGLAAAELDDWLSLLRDRAALEQRFAALGDPPAEAALRVLERAWQMALADGEASQVEIAVFERISERLGVELERAHAAARAWTERAAQTAQVTVALAALLANLDGRMDADEAVAFDVLLGRLALPVSRRLELAPTLYAPPSQAQIEEAMARLEPADRLAALRAVAPMLAASHRGTRERGIVLAIAERVGVDPAQARELLDR